MSTVFDDQLLQSVLSGRAPTSKGAMPKVGEFPVEGPQNAAAGDNGENPLSPVPPYEEIDSSSQQPQELEQEHNAPEPPSGGPVELDSIRPIAQAEGADGLISADEPSNPPKSSSSPPNPSSSPPQPSSNPSKSPPPPKPAAPYNPDSFRAINDPAPLPATKEDPPYPGPTEINRAPPSPTPSPAPTPAPASIPPPPQTPMPIKQSDSNPFPLLSAIPLYALQRDPAPADCPRCRTRSVTKIAYNVSKATHMWAATVGAATLGLALAVPYFVKGTKNVTHFCGSCGVKLATAMHSGRTVIHCHA